MIQWLRDWPVNEICKKQRINLDNSSDSTKKKQKRKERNWANQYSDLPSAMNTKEGKTIRIQKSKADKTFTYIGSPSRPAASSSA